MWIVRVFLDTGCMYGQKTYFCPKIAQCKDSDLAAQRSVPKTKYKGSQILSVGEEMPLGANPELILLSLPFFL